MSYQSDALTRVRLNARHGIPPLGDAELREFCAEHSVEAEAVRAAENEGQALRATGARCMCPYCESSAAAIDGRERLRHHYAARRRAELQAAGVADPAERERTIEREINDGAAFQQGPVTVIRKPGALQ